MYSQICNRQLAALNNIYRLNDIKGLLVNKYVCTFLQVGSTYSVADDVDAILIWAVVARSYIGRPE